jgi:hypothetical protein
MPIEDSNDPQDIEKLSKRHKVLEGKQIAAKALLASSQEKLNELKQQARETYGTDDLVKLREKLEEMKRENERKRATYQSHLNEIENQLTEVERQHAEAVSKESQA